MLSIKTVRMLVSEIRSNACDTSSWSLTKFSKSILHQRHKATHKMHTNHISKRRLVLTKKVHCFVTYVQCLATAYQKAFCLEQFKGQNTGEDQPNNGWISLNGLDWSCVKQWMRPTIENCQEVSHLASMVTRSQEKRDWERLLGPRGTC